MCGLRLLGHEGFRDLELRVLGSRGLGLGSLALESIGRAQADAADHFPQSLGFSFPYPERERLGPHKLQSLEALSPKPRAATGSAWGSSIQNLSGPQGELAGWILSKIPT